MLALFIHVYIYTPQSVQLTTRWLLDRMWNDKHNRWPTALCLLWNRGLSNPNMKMFIISSQKYTQQ